MKAIYDFFDVYGVTHLGTDVYYRKEGIQEVARDAIKFYFAYLETLLATPLFRRKESRLLIKEGLEQSSLQMEDLSLVAPAALMMWDHREEGEPFLLSAFLPGKQPVSVYLGYMQESHHWNCSSKCLSFYTLGSFPNVEELKLENFSIGDML